MSSSTNLKSKGSEHKSSDRKTSTRDNKKITSEMKRNSRSKEFKFRQF